MKLTTFQSQIQDHAFKAHKLKAITDEQYQEYVANAHSYNEEEHARLEEELDKTWRAALDKAMAESNAIYAARDKEWKEKTAAWAYQRNRRISCPPALQFQLWETAKAARIMRAISNSDIRFIRREMREADAAWLQELLHRVEVAMVKKQKTKAWLENCRKEENRRVSCPPKEAFILWGYVKQARQMRLLTNAQVRECRKIRNWGDEPELSKKRAEIMEKIYTKKGVDILKRSLKQQRQERTKAKNSSLIACS